MKSLNSTQSSNTFRFEPKSEKLKRIDVDVVHRVRAKRTLDVIGSLKPLTGQNGCFFQDELERCKDHDSSIHFKKFCYTIFPLVQSLPELIHNLYKVIAVLEESLAGLPQYELGSYLHLIAVLSRDLGSDFSPYFHRVFSRVVYLVIGKGREDKPESTPAKGGERLMTPEIAAGIFECLSTIIKYQSSHLVKDTDSLRQYYGQLLGHPTDYIRDLSARTFAIIIRKLSSQAFKNHIKKVILALSASCQQLFSSSEVSYVERSLVNLNNYLEKNSLERRETDKEHQQLLPNRVDDILNGIMLMIYYSCKGVKGCLHSNGGVKVQTLCQLHMVLSQSAREELGLNMQTVQAITLGDGGGARLETETSKNKKRKVIATKMPAQEHNSGPKSTVENEISTAFTSMDEKKLSFLFYTGKILFQLIQKLMNFLHPTNMGELLGHITIFLGETNDCLSLVSSAFSQLNLRGQLFRGDNHTTGVAYSSFLTGVGIQSVCTSQTLLFCLQNRSGRAVSDVTVMASISPVFIPKLLDYCILGIKLHQHKIISDHNILHQTVLLFCECWRSFLHHGIQVSSIDTILRLLLVEWKPLLDPSVIFTLSRELLPSLPVTVISDSLVKSLLGAVHAISEGSAVAKSSVWLSAFLEITHQLRDTRNPMAVTGVHRVAKQSKGFYSGSGVGHHSSEMAPRLKDRGWIGGSDDEEDGSADAKDDDSDDDEWAGVNHSQGSRKQYTESGVDSYTEGRKLNRYSNGDIADIFKGCEDAILGICKKAINIVLDEVWNSDKETQMTLENTLACRCIRWLIAVNLFPTSDVDISHKVGKVIEKIREHTADDSSIISRRNVYIFAETTVLACDMVMMMQPELRSEKPTNTIITGTSGESVATTIEFLYTLLRHFSLLTIRSPLSVALLVTTAHICDLLHNIFKQQADYSETQTNIWDRVDVSLRGDLEVAICEALCSPSHWIRFSALRIASYFPCARLQSPSAVKGNSSKPVSQSSSTLAKDLKSVILAEVQQDEIEEVDVVAICVEAALIVPSVHSERDYVRHMSRLEVLVRGGRLPTDYIRMICHFALGMMNVKFQPFWEPTVLILVAAAGRDGGDDIVWYILHKTMQGIDLLLAKQEPVHKLSSDSEGHASTDVVALVPVVNSLHAMDDGIQPFPRDTTTSCVFYYSNHTQEEDGIVELDARTDLETVYGILWDVLRRCPSITLKKSKVVVPTFLSFLRDKYFEMFGYSAEVPDLCRLGLFGNDYHHLLLPVESTDSKPRYFTPKILNKRLELFLKVFSVVTSPKQLYQHQLLYAIYQILLSKPDLSIVKLALECIFTYKSEAIITYKDNLKNLLDDSKFRNELAIFDITEDGGFVQTVYRTDLIPLLIRLLYGRFASRSRTCKTSRDLTISRRGAILAFLATLRPDEQNHLLHLMLRSLIPQNYFISTIQNSYPYAESHHYSISDLSGDWEKSVRQLARSLRSKDMAYELISSDVQIGYLYVLEHIIKLIGFGFTEHVDILINFVLIMIQQAETVRDVHPDLQSRPPSTTDSVDDADKQQELEQEDVDVGLEDTEVNETRVVGNKYNVAQSGRIRNLCLLRLSELASQFYGVFDFGSVSQTIWSSLSSLVRSLPSSVSSSNRPSALLRLLYSLTQHEETMTLVTENQDIVRSIIECIGYKCDQNVTKIIIEMILCLIEWNDGQAIYPHAELVIKSFTRRFTGSKKDGLITDLKLSDVSIVQSSAVKLELNLLCEIAKGIFHRSDIVLRADHIGNLAILLLGMLRAYTTSRKIRPEEETVLDILGTYRALIVRLESVLPHVPFLSKLFGPAQHSASVYNLTSVRLLLVEIYQDLALHPSTSGILVPSGRAISDLVAVDMKYIESRDFERCMLVFQQLSCENSDTAESLWSLLLGPSAHDHPRGSSSCYVVVFECFRCLFDKELLVRSASLAALKTLITEAFKWSNQSKEIDFGNISWLEVIKSVMIPQLHQGLKQSADNLKKNFVHLLSHLVRVTGQYPSENPDVCHRDLNCLFHVDPEQDFFENIIHIQIHRRVRAMARLKTVLEIAGKSTDSAPTIGLNSIMHVLVPLTYHPLFSDEFNKKDHQNVLQEAANLMGAIALNLPWSSYLAVIRTLLRKLENDNQLKEKILLTSLCNVLDSFHFDLTSKASSDDSITINDDTDDKRLDEGEDDDEDAADETLLSGPVDNENDSKEPVRSSTTSNGGSAISTKGNMEQTNKIAVALLDFVLPWVKKFLIKEEKDHKGDKSHVVRPQVALALTKLVKRLEPPVVSSQKKKDLFQNLVIRVIGTLRSRDSAFRDLARESLAKMILTLGMESLHTVLQELVHMLTEGYQRHVRNYSIKHILEVILENYSPPVDAPSVDISLVKNVEFNVNPVMPIFDRSITLLTDVILDDLTGVTQEDRDAQDADRTLIREAKGSKSNDILELCAKSILFRPTYALLEPNRPTTVSSIHALTSPLLSSLRNCEDKLIIGRVGEALQRTALGLSKNPSLLASELLLYLHSTLQPFILIIVKDFRRNRLLNANLIQKNNPKTLHSDAYDEVELDSALYEDLPSYLKDDVEEDEDLLVVHSKRSRLNPKDDISGVQPSIWLPYERKVISDKRAALEEQQREKRRLVEVQDGLNAPKLTGRNRHVEGKGVSKEGRSTDPATIVAVKYCLTLLNSSLKQNRLDKDDTVTLHMASPFLPLLAQCIRLSAAEGVVAVAMRCLCTLLSWGLYVSPTFSRAVGAQIIKLMSRGGAFLSTAGDLVQACMRGLTALYQLYSRTLTAKKSDAQHQAALGDINVLSTLETPVDSLNSAGKSAKVSSDELNIESEAGYGSKPPLNNEQARALLTLLMASITDVHTTNQAAAFQLIKAIIEAKIMLPEVYDLISKLTEQICLTHKKSVRESASNIFVSFILNYPLSDKRLGGHIKQLINNCEYEYEEGRLGALETLVTVVKLLPTPILDQYAPAIFLTMTVRIVNDSAQTCRKQAAEVILAVVRRCSNDLSTKFIDYTSRWLSAGGQSMDSGNSLSLIRTGAQIAGLLVQGRPDLFKKNSRINPIINLIIKNLNSLVGEDKYRYMSAEERRIALSEITEHAEDECAGGIEEWTIIYHLLVSLEKFFIHLPSPTDHIVTHYHEDTDVSQESSSLPFPHRKSKESGVALFPVMETVQECLIYPHTWVRSSSCRVLSEYLKRRDAPSGRLSTSADSFEFLEKPNGLFHLGRRLCVILNQPSIEESFLLKLISCLVFVIRAMNRRPDLVQTRLDATEKQMVDSASQEADLKTQYLEEEEKGDINEDEAVDNESRSEANIDTTDPDGGALQPSSKAVSGENWVLQRLRGLAVDRRGRRRFYVLKIFSTLVQIESVPFVINHLKQFIEGCVRAHNISNDPDDPVEKETKDIANDLLGAIEKKVGSALYLAAFSEVQSMLKKKKLETKAKSAAEAVSDPRSFARRKIQKNLAKKANGKKRKLRDIAIKGLKRGRSHADIPKNEFDC